MEGKIVGNITLPERIFGLPWNADLVHQVVTSMQANARTPIAHTKGSGEVRGGGKKPWQQKGTGRARHGSSRSPIWRGGGTTHGPRNEKDYSRRINKKMRVKALYTVLSRKFKDNELIFVDKLVFSAPKTVQAMTVLAALSGVGFEVLSRKKHHAALVVLPEPNDFVQKSFRNIGNVGTEDVRNLNPVTALGHKYLVMVSPDKVISVIAAKTGAVVVATPSPALGPDKLKAKKPPVKRTVLARGPVRKTAVR